MASGTLINQLTVTPWLTMVARIPREFNEETMDLIVSGHQRPREYDANLDYSLGICRSHRMVRRL